MFRYKEYVYAVYKEGSFSDAAEKLFLSQPCLSAMVKKAENQLGVPIFDRTTKPISLTEYGMQYIDFIEKIQALEYGLEQYLNDVRGLRTGSLFVGVNHVLASYILPGLIHKFKELYPGIQIQMIEGNISFLENALMTGTVDLILDNCPMSSDLFHQQTLKTEHLLLAVHNQFRQDDILSAFRLTYKDILANRHLLPDAPTISIREFSHIPFIALSEGNDTRYRMDMLFSAAEKTPNIHMVVDQLATAYNISCNKLGATLVSDTLIHNSQPNPEMDFYMLDGTTTVRPIYLYYKRSRYISLAMREFLDLVYQFFSETSNPTPNITPKPLIVTGSDMPIATKETKK